MAVKSKSGSAKSDKATTKDELKVENVQADGDVEVNETVPVAVKEGGAGMTNGRRDEIDPLASGATTYGEDIKAASEAARENGDNSDEFSQTKQEAAESVAAQENGDEFAQDEAATDRVEPGTDDDSEDEVDDEPSDEAEAQGVAGMAKDSAEDTGRIDTSEL